MVVSFIVVNLMCRHVVFTRDRRVVVLVAVQTAQAGVYRLALAWLDRATSQQQQSSSTAFTIRMTKLFNASVPEVYY